MIKLNTTLGTITLELDRDKAPNTVANFEQYVRDGFYNGTIFHRVIDRFMIQGGGMEPGLQQKATRDPIKNEADNPIFSLKLSPSPDHHQYIASPSQTEDGDASSRR